MSASTGRSDSYRRTLPPVRNLRATTQQAPVSQTIVLDWERPDPDRAMDHYIVYGSPVAGFSPSQATLTVRVPWTTYLHAGLAASGQTWHFRVVAVDAAGRASRFRHTDEVSTTTAKEGLPRVPAESLAVTATSAQLPAYAAEYAIDGDPATFWHSQYGPRVPMPQAITLDMGDVRPVTALTYLPRQDGDLNGTVTSYRVDVSRDGSTFTRATTGRWWALDTESRFATWPAADARYVRLEVLGGYHGYACAADIGLFVPPGR